MRWRSIPTRFHSIGVVLGGWVNVPDDAPEFGISVSAGNWKDDDGTDDGHIAGLADRLTPGGR